MGLLMRFFKLRVFCIKALGEEGIQIAGPLKQLKKHKIVWSAAHSRGTRYKEAHRVLEELKEELVRVKKVPGEANTTNYLD